MNPPIRPAISPIFRGRLPPANRCPNHSVPTHIYIHAALLAQTNAIRPLRRPVTRKVRPLQSRPQAVGLRTWRNSKIRTAQCRLHERIIATTRIALASPATITNTASRRANYERNSPANASYPPSSLGARNAKKPYKPRRQKARANPGHTSQHRNQPGRVNAEDNNRQHRHI